MRNYKKMAKGGKVVEDVAEGVDKVSEAVGYPQKVLAQKLGEQIGIKGDTSEEVYRQAVSRLADKVRATTGVNTEGRAGKAVQEGLTQGVNQALDPVNYIPVVGLAGKALKVARAAKPIRNLLKLADKSEETSPFKPVGKDTPETERRINPMESGDKPVNPHRRPGNLTLEEKNRFVEQKREADVMERRRRAGLATSSATRVPVSGPRSDKLFSKRLSGKIKYSGK